MKNIVVEIRENNYCYSCIDLVIAIALLSILHDYTHHFESASESSSF